jgi:CBS domain-containing protein
MLSTPASSVAVEPVMVGLSDGSETLMKFRSKTPVFAVSDGVFVVDLESAGPGRKVSQISKKITPVPGDTPLCEVARLMVENGVNAYPVNGNPVKGVTSEMIINAVKGTSEFSKREARTIMSHAAVLPESKVQGAEGVSHKMGIEVVAVVNASGKLVGVWSGGRVMKRPVMVRLGTRVKLVIDKLGISPVVVVDKQRSPVGIVTKRDILELAASFREYTVPVFYSGLDVLSFVDAEPAKTSVIEAIQKVNKVTPVKYASVNVAKKGVWVVKVKLSTPLRMFLAHGENEDFRISLSETLSRLVNEVMSEKKKRLKLRKLP